MTEPHNSRYNATGIHAFWALIANGFNFRGKSTRQEFWWAVLVNTVILTIPILFLVPFLHTVLFSFFWVTLVAGPSAAEVIGAQLTHLLFPMIITVMILGFPYVALTVRRFRDAGLHWSTSWLLLAGQITWLIVFAHRPVLLANWLTVISLVILGLTLLPTATKQT